MSDKTRIRGGALLARALKEKGVDHVFTLAGGFCNPALEGFMECQMPVVNCPHEQVAVNLAGWHGKKLGGILHPGNYSLLGVGVSFALSAKSLHPDKQVVLISGDGAFLSGGLSIEAAFQERLPITVVIDNNGGLDCISQQQERLFASGKHFATDFRDISFHAMFEGLGGHGELVTKREELAPALRRAMASGKTACVNVKCRGVISPIVAATSDKRDKASIE